MSTKKGIWQERKRVFELWISLTAFDNGFFVVFLDEAPRELGFFPGNVVCTYFDRQTDRAKCRKDSKKFALENFNRLRFVDGWPVSIVKQEVA